MAYLLPQNERVRLDKLHSLAVLTPEDDPILDTLVEIGCISAKMPIGSIALLDAEWLWFKANRGLTEKKIPRDHAFCNYTILDDTPLVIPDAEKDSRFSDNPFVRGKEHIRFYAGVPIEVEPGIRIGCLCVLDRKPRELDRDAMQILRWLADCAAERLRQRGNARLLEFFSARRRDQLKASLKMIDAAKIALAQNAFTLFYQPKYELRTRRRVGFEALLRWRQADGSTLAPAAFAEALDDPEFSRRIGSYVLAEAISQAKTWQRAGFEFGHIAINVSSSQFANEEGKMAFADEVMVATKCASLSPSRLHIEVTEGVLLSRVENHVAKQLAQLRATGFKVAFDDFGTGFASLIHLKELEYDQIKIDGSFVRAMISSEGDMAIVKAVVGLARNLGKEVVAEGIETEAELSALIEMGCGYGQGYLLGRPTAASGVTEVVGNAK
ncbi:EAL domain-containing protein [Rhizobium ruizarguesonis]|uniref:EAL domain-containing protein n=1 Tax=Rhizobium ruizarguesonis TaxID=2081791 RepID=A0AB38HSL4_9HYPH|nr:EAL domain-containing protein [Rhizobium ruizarguesonis]TBC01445.1 EAL domain-containing protein [Rhizobium ruizarguesonis]